MTSSLKVVVCALIAAAPMALLIEGLNVTTAQAQAQSLASLTAERNVDSSTATAVLVD
jgi:hypothetical protein